MNFLPKTLLATALFFFVRESLALDSFSRPRGIYVVDSGAGHITNGISLRDTNIRTNDFVSGYMLRVAWQAMEPNKDQIDFTVIDWNVRRLAALNKKLSLWIISVDPSWLAQTPGVATWYDSDPNVNHARAVPWDPFLLQRMEVFLNALAEHTIDGVKLKDHPTLAVFNFGLTGAGLSIRDPVAINLRNMTNYTRTAFTNAVLRNLRATVTNFPTKFVHVGFWPVLDAQSSPPLWQDLRQAILAEFNGSVKPRVGFWMENLSASRPTPGGDPVTGGPTTGFGSALYLSQTNTWVGFQALTSWVKPFNNFNSQVTNATPADGMKYATDTFGSTYFEIYVDDIDNLNYRADFQKWRARLFPPDQISLVRTNAGKFQIQWPSWPGGVYQVEASDDLTAWITNSPELSTTNTTSYWPQAASSTARFFRLRTLP
jgi:hypothetical protein